MKIYQSIIDLCRFIASFLPVSVKQKLQLLYQFLFLHPNAKKILVDEKSIRKYEDTIQRLNSRIGVLMNRILVLGESRKNSIIQHSRIADRLKDSNRILKDKIASISEYNSNINILRPQFARSSFMATHSIFKAGAFVDLNNDKLQADLYIANEPETVLPSILLKANHNARAIWYIKEHVSYLQRSFTYDNFSMENRICYANLDKLIACASRDLDGALCTGEGYRQIGAELGIPAINVNRRFPAISTISDQEGTAAFNTFMNDVRKPGRVLIAYPGTIYTSCDFSTVLKTMKLLPDNFHLVHFGGFRPMRMRDNTEFDCLQFGIENRMHFMGQLPLQIYMNMLTQCNIGLAHLSPNIGSNRLSLHNRFIDMLAAEIPFAYSENVSASAITAIKKHCRTYDWWNPEDLRRILIELASNSEKLRKDIRADIPELKKRDVLEKYVSQSDARSVIFLGLTNICLNKPTAELARMFLEAGSQVKYLSFQQKASWESADDKVSGIEILNF